jgi:DNA processing protein
VQHAKAARLKFDSAITEKLKAGAWCLVAHCHQWQDVAAELPPDIAARLLPPEIKKKEGKQLSEQLSLVPDGLSEIEHTVFKLLSTDEATHIDSLVESSHLSIPQLTGALLGLEMRELIRQLPGKCFVRKL